MRKPRDSFSLEFDLKQDWKRRKEFEQKCRQEGPVNEPFFLFGDRVERIAGCTCQLSSELLSEAAAVSGHCLLSLTLLFSPLLFLSSLYYGDLLQLFLSLLSLLLFSLCLFITL